MVRHDGFVVGNGLDYSCDPINLVFSYSRGGGCVEFLSMFSLKTSSSVYASVGPIVALESCSNDVEGNSMDRRERLKSARGKRAPLEDTEVRWSKGDQG